ncbi:unnamed protein product [Toxocara canis]|uniref:Uncharacterized protein n=1 Tax=Toxocara canis TaxID=6265 RepID=A0A183UEI3_TOXCA|nr:unnamed protein product [Toxocara canis]
MRLRGGIRPGGTKPFATRLQYRKRFGHTPTSAAKTHKLNGVASRGHICARGPAPSETPLRSTSSTPPPTGDVSNGEAWRRSRIAFFPKRTVKKEKKSGSPAEGPPGEPKLVTTESKRKRNGTQSGAGSCHIYSDGGEGVDEGAQRAKNLALLRPSLYLCLNVGTSNVRTLTSEQAVDILIHKFRNIRVDSPAINETNAQQISSRNREMALRFCLARPKEV